MRAVASEWQACHRLLLPLGHHTGARNTPAGTSTNQVFEILILSLGDHMRARNTPAGSSTNQVFEI